MVLLIPTVRNVFFSFFSAFNLHAFPISVSAGLAVYVVGRREGEKQNTHNNNYLVLRKRTHKRVGDETAFVGLKNIHVDK